MILWGNLYNFASPPPPLHAAQHDAPGEGSFGCFYIEGEYIKKKKFHRVHFHEVKMRDRGVESGCPGGEGVSGDAVSLDRTFWFLFVARTKRNAPAAAAPRRDSRFNKFFKL